ARDLHSAARHQGSVVAEHVVGDVDGGAGLVQNAAAASIRGAHGAAVGDGQPGNGHGRRIGDVEDPAGVVPGDNQLVGPWSLDVQVFVDYQLATGQHDGVTLELVREVDGIAAAGGGDGGA